VVSAIFAKKSAVFSCLTNALAPPLIALESCSTAQTDRPVYAQKMILLCTEDDNSCYRNVCKMSVVLFALAIVFITLEQSSDLRF